MLEVIFFRDERDRPAGFSARGHTDFAEHGQDIVCAAVSAILQAARLGVERYAQNDARASQKPGRLDLRWSESHRDLESLTAIAVTAELAIAEIVRRFPEHVRLSQERISSGEWEAAPRSG